MRIGDSDKTIPVKVILKHLYPFHVDVYEDEWDKLVEKMLDEAERG